MNEKTSAATCVLIALCIIGVMLFALGFSVGKDFWQGKIQDSAVESGCAEWIAPEGGRGEAVLKWIEAEGVEEYE